MATGNGVWVLMKRRRSRTGPKPRPVEERLLAKVERDYMTGCLRWTGLTDKDGYGKITVGGRIIRVHRLAYETWVGPIPDGLVIDHVHGRGCRFKDCIEPSHLEPVTASENTRRANLLRPAATHCRNGHEFTPANTYVQPRPEWCPTCVSRKCRECQRAGGAARAAAGRRREQTLERKAA